MHGNQFVTGEQAVIVYHLLGDPAVSDRYELLKSDIVLSLQEEDKVMALVDVRYHILNPGPGIPSLKDTQSIWIFTFHPQTREVTDITIYIDTLFIATSIQASYNTTPEFICSGLEQFCDPAGYPQFSSHAECLAYMDAVPDGMTGQLSGFNRHCRSFHLELAEQLPQLHCVHVGPQNLGPTITPCQNYGAKRSHSARTYLDHMVEMGLATVRAPTPTFAPSA